MEELGATVFEGGTRFRVWAPRPRSVELILDGRRAMQKAAGDFWEIFVDGVGAGARYSFLLDGERRRPDPASRAQPDGVHGASEVVDPRAFEWRHPRPRRRLDEYVIYELHVGAFTRAGTFDAAAAELDRLVELGVTAVELMPVGAFPGARNWGYDGVSWFAPHAGYGGPDGLRRFVDAAHARSLAVVLDVVYNHLGPEGNYWSEFAPYFTSRKKTPWGDALDWAAGPVRAHALASARRWVEEFRLDALRLDAVHALLDDSPRPIAAAIADELRPLGAHAIAESDLGDARVIEERGWHCAAQWADDLHHALHAAVTGERDGYYGDFGSASALARSINEGFVYTGQFSKFRGRGFGTPVKHLPGERFVVCAQNHDQVGNRARGERIGHLRAGCEPVVAAAYLLAPSLPLIFMGEEHADPAPFLFFSDFQDAALARAVTDGRRREHAWRGVEVPDPQALETFERSGIDLALGERGRHAEVRTIYRHLIALRRERASLRALDRSRTEARADDTARVLAVRRWSDTDETIVFINFADEPRESFLPTPVDGEWQMLLATGGATVRNRTDVFLPALTFLVCGTAPRRA